MTTGASHRFGFVVFDWSGTLKRKTNTKKLREASALSAALKMLDNCDVENLSLLFKHEKKKMESRKQLHETQTIEHFLRHFLKAANVNEPATCSTFIETFMDVYTTPVNGAAGLLYDGAERLLEELRKNDLPFALVRNSNLPATEFQKELQRAGVEKYFHVDRNVVLAGEEGVMKPDKKIFEAILQKCQQSDLHQTHPHRIIFVGNETQIDVVGAANMGWQSILVKHTEESSNGLASFDVNTLAEVILILFPPQHS